MRFVRAEERRGNVEREVREKFGDLVYGADVSSLEEVVFGQLKEKRLTLGTAESCTGGLIAKRVTDLAGSSAVFRGGVVSYTDEVKRDVLGVPAELLKEHGAVSAPVAEAMARGAKRLLGSDLAISATGVAGPDGDDRGNPVGLVFVALCTEEGCTVKELHLGAGRNRIRTTASNYALDLARRYLLTK
jgi:nicotinamide-nucleotide amidase